MRLSTTVSAALLVGLSATVLWLSFTGSGSRTLDALAVRRVPGHPSHLRSPQPDRVLIVGDGTAFGLGVDRASSWSARLRASPDFDAVDRVAPRLDVRTALRDLPVWLVETCPSVVVVCLGIDEGLEPAEPFTAKEVRLLQAWVGSDGLRRDLANGEQRLVGRWRSPNGLLELRRDGTADFHGLEASWAVDGDRLEILRARSRTVFRWEFVDAFLKLDSDELDLHLSYENEDRSREPIDLIERALALGRLTEAEVRIATLERVGDEAAEPLRAALDCLRGRSSTGWPGAYTGGLAPLPDSFVADLRAMVAMIRRAGAGVILVGHPPEALVTDRTIREFARSEGVEFVAPTDGAERDGAFLQSAPRYWSPEGHRTVAAEVASVVRRRLAAGRR